MQSFGVWFVAVLLLMPPQGRVEPPPTFSLPEVGDRVQIGAKSLGPGWHDRTFNRKRTEESCHLILLFVPRETPQSPSRVVSTIEWTDVARLRIISKSTPQPMHEWAGQAEADAKNLFWQEADRRILISAQRDETCVSKVRRSRLYSDSKKVRRVRPTRAMEPDA